MSEHQKIREMIRRIASAGESVWHFTAEVKSSDDALCTVMLGDLELTGVRLFSIDDAGTLMIKPGVKSTVTVADLSGGQLRDLVLVKVDDPERILYSRQGLVVDIDSKAGKVNVANSSTSLTKILDDLYDLLKTFKVLTPQGPSEGLQVDTTVKLEQLKTTYKKLLK